MEIIKSKNGTIAGYREMIWLNNRPVKSPTFRRKTDCNKWKADQVSNKEKNLVYGDSKVHEKITLNEYCELWYQTKLAQAVSNSTQRNYESVIRKHIKPFFKNLIMKNISKKDVEQFQLSLIKNHKPKGVNIIVITLKSIFKESIKEGYLIKSPCEFVKSLRSDKKHEVYWAKPEIDQFLRANFNNYLYDLFVVALNTGMRKGELAGLCWDRIDFVNNTIAVTRTRDRRELKERTKTNSIRMIPMNSIVKTIMLRLFKDKTSRAQLEDYVFLDANQNPIEPHHLYRQFNRAQKKAQLKRQIRFHDLRHTFASQFVLGGGSVYDLQKFLGHTDISMTTRYAHHSMEHLQAAMKDFSLGDIHKIESENNIKEIKFSQILTREAI